MRAGVPVAGFDPQTVAREDIPAVLASIEQVRAALWARLMAPSEAATAPVAVTWRERLWTAPAETRLGVREVAEAAGRPPSWVYRQPDIPRRKQGGELVFTAGEVRDWLSASERRAEHQATPLIPIDRKRRTPG